MNGGLRAAGNARRRWARALVFASGGLFGACASAPPATYDLGVIQGGFKARPRGGQIAVYEPKAVSPVASDRIVVRLGADQIAYLSGAQWAGQLPALVQARLISSFLNAHVIGAVEPDGIADYNLRTTIRRFEFDAGRAAVFVEMSAQLADSSGRVRAGKVFSASAPAPGDDAATVTQALDFALAEVMRQIVLWTAPQI